MPDQRERAAVRRGRRRFARRTPHAGGFDASVARRRPRADVVRRRGRLDGRHRRAHANRGNGLHRFRRRRLVGSWTGRRGAWLARHPAAHRSPLIVPSRSAGDHPANSAGYHRTKQTAPMTTTGILLVSCPDRPGIVAAVASFVAAHGGNVIDLQQHTDHTDGAFFQRVEFELDDFDLDRAEHRPRRSRRWPTGSPCGGRCASRTSGPGWRCSPRRSRTAFTTCSIAGAPASSRSTSPLVASNHPDHADAGRVVRRRVRSTCRSSTTTRRRRKLAAARRCCASTDVDLVVLARYMQILSPGFCDEWPERIINIHHSFLPAFQGARPYHQAHERGVKLVGVTAHYATADVGRRADHRSGRDSRQPPRRRRRSAAQGSRPRGDCPGPRRASPCRSSGARLWSAHRGVRLMRSLADGVDEFAEHGWLLTRDLDERGVSDLVRWVDEVSSWPDDGDGWLHYRELTDDGPKLCRTENFVPFHDGLRTLLTTGAMLGDGVGAARRARSALQGEDQLQASGRRRLRAASGRSRVPLRRRRTCRAWSRSTTPSSTTAASRSRRACTPRCFRPTSTGASAPTSSTR